MKKEQRTISFLSLFLLILLGLTCQGFSNDIPRDGKPINMWKYSYYIGTGNLFSTNENPITRFALGVRYGVTRDSDLGVALWNYGVLADYRYRFIGSDTYIGSFDVEAGASYQSFLIGCGFYLDITMHPDFVGFLSAKWRYCTGNPIDNPSGIAASGILCIPAVGFELFGNRTLSLFGQYFSFLVEAGTIIGWQPRLPSPTVSVCIRLY